MALCMHHPHGQIYVSARLIWPGREIWPRHLGTFKGLFLWHPKTYKGIQCQDQIFQWLDQIFQCLDQIFQCQDQIFQCQDQIFQCQDQIFQCKYHIFQCKDNRTKFFIHTTLAREFSFIIAQSVFWNFFFSQLTTPLSIISTALCRLHIFFS